MLSSSPSAPLPFEATEDAEEARFPIAACLERAGVSDEIRTSVSEIAYNFTTVSDSDLVSSGVSEAPSVSLQ